LPQLPAQPFPHSISLKRKRESAAETGADAESRKAFAMKSRTVAGLPAILVAAAMIAQDARATGACDSGDAALIALEQRWAGALVQADTRFLSGLLADGFVDAGENGHIGAKAELLQVLGSGALRIRQLELSELKIHVRGETAIVTGKARQQGSFEGRPIAPSVVFTDTFVCENGAWLALAAQRAVPASP
jgi:hypothetical protein